MPLFIIVNLSLSILAQSQHDFQVFFKLAESAYIGLFFIAVSLGKITIDKTAYFVISSASPIGKNLIGLKPNDNFTFNGKNYIIEGIL